MADFDLSLERNQYATGETAKGTLVISAGRGFQLRGLKFYVCGVEISSITERKEYALQTLAIPNTYNESNTFFYEDFSAFLLKSIGNIIRSDDDDGGSSSNRLEVPKGVWKIPFESTIPKYTYESYDGKYVSIIYGIIFTADKAWGKDVKEKMSFTVFLNTMPTNDNIKDWSTDIIVEGEGISLRLYLEDSKNTFSPGDTIKGKLIVENSSGRKRIKNAEIILRGIESTYASNSTRISTIETYKQKVEFNGEDSNSVPFEIHIPKEVKRSYKAVYSKYY